MRSSSETQTDCDFIVVGSGAGGGTVAARLAEAGWRVVLLEAGGDPKLDPTGDSASDPAGDPDGDPRGEASADSRFVATADAMDDLMDRPLAVSRGGAIEAAAREAPDDGRPIARRRSDDYDVPAFHAAATEQTPRWDFFVRHYTDRARQARDPKYCTSANGAPVDGVLYPRAGALGGCTAHGAMILLYPHNQDWDDIAELTGDRTWRAEAMRTYFEQLEDCRHRPGARLLRRFGLNRTRHGWHGWLRTEKAIPAAALDDRDLFGMLQQSAREAFLRAGQAWERRGWRLDAQGDPNDWRLVRANAAGLRYLPLSTRGHRRMGARERITETMALHPDRLRLELDALATRIIWDGNRAVGIEYLKGARLYRAACPSRAASGEPRRLSARFDVILAGGAFNTPQLLMLSGIGPRETLEQHGIPVVQDLAGVGRNLQDRYEVSVVNRMNFARWHALRGATFASGDPLHAQWSSRGRGFYGTNGAVLAVVRRSARARAVPDLCCFARLGLFKGYFPAYSALVPRHVNYLTWCVVKAHTNNRAGEVTLRSADPRDPPLINFRYFDEGSDTTGEDLESVVEGIRFSRLMMQPLVRRGLVAEEELPGPAVQSDDDLRQFVRDQAWGHDASCSCAIGPRDQGGVLTSDFRVHGTRGLRVVDASIFPRIPGFFIASAIYMAGEKAADVIGAQAKRGIAR